MESSIATSAMAPVSPTGKTTQYPLRHEYTSPQLQREQKLVRNEKKNIRTLQMVGSDRITSATANVVANLSKQIQSLLERTEDEQQPTNDDETRTAIRNIRLDISKVMEKYLNDGIVANNNDAPLCSQSENLPPHASLEASNKDNEVAPFEGQQHQRHKNSQERLAMEGRILTKAVQKYQRAASQLIAENISSQGGVVVQNNETNRFLDGEKRPCEANAPSYDGKRDEQREDSKETKDSSSISHNIPTTICISNNDQNQDQNIKDGFDLNSMHDSMKNQQTKGKDDAGFEMKSKDKSPKRKGEEDPEFDVKEIYNDEDDDNDNDDDEDDDDKTVLLSVKSNEDNTTASKFEHQQHDTEAKTTCPIKNEADSISQTNMFQKEKTQSSNGTKIDHNSSRAITAKTRCSFSRKRQLDSDTDDDDDDLLEDPIFQRVLWKRTLMKPPPVYPSSPTAAQRKVVENLACPKSSPIDRKKRMEKKRRHTTSMMPRKISKETIDVISIDSD